jgi:hypothetical protein
MANMCTICCNLQFDSEAKRDVFIKVFSGKITEAQKYNQGVQIAESTWLFDTTVESNSEKGVSIQGWVKWCLDRESIAEFTEYLKTMGIESFECSYEEIGNLIFGNYTYDGENLWDTFISDSGSIWDCLDEDEYIDQSESHLETDGEVEHVA